jgi:hypothetical protein
MNLGEIESEGCLLFSSDLGVEDLQDLASQRFSPFEELAPAMQTYTYTVISCELDYYS